MISLCNNTYRARELYIPREKGLVVPTENQEAGYAMNKRRVSVKDIFTVKKSYVLKILLIIYLLSFLGATYNHAMDLIKYGLFPYQRLNSNVPVWLNIYWTLLTIFDPLAIIFLLYSLNMGLVLYGVVIVSDVLINYWFMISTKGLFSWINFGQISQLLFLVFYLATVRLIYKETQKMQRENQ